MLLIALRDLQQRRKQFAVAIVGGALVFAMALIMTGLAGGFRSEARNTVRDVGADGFVVRNGVGGPFTGYSGIPGNVVGIIARTPGVTEASPLVVSLQPLLSKNGTRADTHLIGYRVGALGQPKVSKGRDALRAGEIVADKRAKVKLGEIVSLAGKNETVVGITTGLSYDAGLANAYVTIAEAQRAAYGGGQIITSVAFKGHLSVAPKGLAIVSDDAAHSDMLRKLKDAIAAIDNVKYFLWVVAAVIIGIVTFLSALERVRDFAVLKAVGASAKQLFSGLAMQAILVSVLASLLSLVLTQVLKPLLPLPIDIPRSSLLALPFVAIIVGLISSLAGVQQAVRVDPALAFGA